MISNRYRFYNKSNQNHSHDGGPRCYFEFEYKDKRIILIGDRHYSLPIAIGKQYQYVFNQSIDGNHKENKNIMIFVEETPDHVSKETGERGLLDILSSLKKNSTTQIILSDDRVWDDGLVDSINFLRKVEEIDDQIRIKLKSRRIKMPKVILFPKNNEGLDKALKDLASAYEDKISFNQWQKLFEMQMDKLIDLLKTYEDYDYNLGKFIAECYLELYLAYEDFLKLKNDYSVLYNGEDFGEKYLDEICIKMINHEGSFQSVGRWLAVFSSYVQSFLDATLACKLWNEIHGNENTQILMIGAGSAHV